MDKKEFIKNLISINKDAKASIHNLEIDAASIEIKNDKDKANFGNMCVMLRGYRMIADATEAMLINEDVLQDENGDFYQKIVDEPRPEEGSDKENK